MHVCSSDRKPRHPPKVDGFLKSLFQISQINLGKLGHKDKSKSQFSCALLDFNYQRRFDCRSTSHLRPEEPAVQAPRIRHPTTPCRVCTPGVCLATACPSLRVRCPAFGY